MKIFVDSISKEMDVLPQAVLDEVVHVVPCSYKGCKGKVHFLYKQSSDGSAVVCDKCNRSIIFKEIEA